MNVPLRTRDRAQVQPARGLAFQEYWMPDAEIPESEGRAELTTAELAFRIAAAFRAHPHINNVLTHISRAKWADVENSLNRILDVATTGDDLSSLDENIIELMVGERGITGKILKPYLLAGLRRIVGPTHAERLARHVNALYLELEWKVQHPSPEPPQSTPSKEPNDARDELQ